MKTKTTPTAPKRLGELQLSIMKILWEKGSVTVGEVQKALQPGKDLAYTTVATMLRKLEEKRLVTHTTKERTYIYQAAVREESVSKSMAGELLDKLFEGNIAGMVSHLLTARDVSTDELDALDQLIQSKKKETKS
ncbi:MAG: BlaI/MecI/CopY family transcriptional regulator [Verrucomicrobia bacterium]|jgi:BlaI family transcriptional regulator, penicillinase repressor|nr:BlaI/MecI/CopY family transcriptional regulator [Verrucomicrobiota bacterium]